MNSRILFPAKRLLYLVLCFAYPCHGWAQADNALAFPSANNTFLGTAGTVRSGTMVSVDLYTGTAMVNIPISSLASKELTIPIALDYTGGRGIRVQDYAGPAGLGWQLDAGGSISRVVRCFPDEQPNGYLGDGQLPAGAIGTGLQWGKVIENNYANGVGLTSAQYVAITGQNTNGSYTTPTADGEPDIYYVKTPYFSFQFTFDETGTPVLSNNNGMKISTSNFVNSASYNNSSFEVIDDQGNEYYFGSSSQSVETSTVTLFGASYTFPTTWYLDKIVSYNSKDIITLNYKLTGNQDINKHYLSSTSFDQAHSDAADNTPVQTIVNLPKVVTQIISPLGEADFTYAMDRRDDINAARLSTVTMIGYNPQTASNSDTLQAFNFNYSYFNGASSDTNLLRLRLDNITVTGKTAATAAPLTLRSFLYDTAINLPQRQSLSAVDFWGYYTYTASPNPYNLSLPPNQSYAMADLLTSIKDVSGNNYQIGYELNSYGSANTQVGGLRVNQVTQRLATGDSLYTQYKYVGSDNNSSGQILSNSYLINELIIPTSASCTGWTLYKTMSESPSDYYDLNGNFVGYSTVKVLDQKGGYSKYSFSNFSDFADTLNYSAAGGIPDITSSVSLAYKRGLLLDLSVYNASGQILSEDASPLASYASLTPYTRKAWAYRWGSYGISVTASGYANSCTFGGSSSYWTDVQNFRLIKSVHTDYDQKDTTRYVQTTNTYRYSPVNARLIKAASTTDSKGHTLSKDYYYPDESGIPMTSTELTALTDMVNANRIDIPIHELDTLNGVVVQAHNSYVTGAGSNNNGFANTYLASSTSYNGAIQAKQQLYGYDQTTSNLSSSSMLNGRPTSYVYGYNASLPTVKAVNALPGEVYYESFEEYSTDPNFAIGNAHSGSFYYNGNYTVPFALPDGKSYLIQWWSYSGSTWSFNEQPYTGSRTLTGPVDDIRIFPTDALVTSFTYQPLTGKTSEMDPSGKSQHYEYDGLGRLSLVRDQDHNIVRKICYDYTGQTENCATTYWNMALTKTFTKNTCSPATGSQVVYTIPVGKYSSALSQQDADQQAQNDMTANGQSYANTNGACFIPVSLVNNCTANNIMVVTMTAGSASYPGSFDPLPGTTASMTLPPTATSYTITITVKPGGSAAYFFVNGIVQYGTTVTFSNVGISSALTIIACTNYYYNIAESGTFNRNNCTAPQVGSPVTYTIAANTYISYSSQTDANQQAVNAVNAGGPAYANAHGVCAQFFNIAESGVFTRSCTSPQTGTQVTYTVPAYAYSSNVSQTDANQQAINDVNANGQAYANSHGTCYTAGVTLTNNSAGLGGTCVAYFKNGTTTVASDVFPTTQGSSTTFTNVPNGTYSVEVLIVRGTVAKKFTINGVSMTGTDVTFSSITVSNTGNLTITASDN